METCGYCDGTGQVETRPYDNEGRERGSGYPHHRQCEYCDGEGVCVQGDSLLPAARPRTGLTIQG